MPDEQQIKPPPGYDIDPTKIVAPKGYDIVVNPAIPSNAGIRPQTASDTFRENIGRTIAGFFPALGGALGASVPGAEPVTAPLGTMTGSALSYGLKKQFPQLFGQLPESYLDKGQSGAPEEMAKDLLANNAGPAALSKLVTKIPGIAHILESERLGENSKGLRGFLTKPAQQAEFMAAPKQELNDVIYKGFSPTTGKIDPVTILDELEKNPTKYSNIPQDTKNNLTQFLTNLKDQKSLWKGESPYLVYDKKRIYYSLGSAAITGSVAGTTGAAGMGALLLTHDMLSRALQNPTASKALIAITKPGLEGAKPLLDKLIIGAMSGANSIYKSASGDEQPVRIGDGGQLVPIR